METELWLSGVGFPRFSARGCVQELYPIVAQKDIFQRTVNGDLVYLGGESDVKYGTTIKCQDKNIPAFAHLWRGSLIEVGCLQSLIQTCESLKTTLGRPFIKGSLRVFNAAYEGVKDYILNGQEVTVVSSGGYVSYRPILSMRLTDFTLTHNEWGSKVGWSLTLEEA